MSNFNNFNLKPEILKALSALKYEIPTPIQNKTIRPIMEGNDLIACAQTGTGKTAAFALPILNEIKSNKNIQVLVLTPTRELALQIKNNFDEYSKNLNVKSVVIYGGVKQHKQVSELRKHPDILIATPGRLLDLINQRYINLSELNYFVLDEADNMLDMGFIHDIRRLLKVIPTKRQTLLFSATMPAEIRKLASSILYKPIEVSVAPVSSAVDTVKQNLYFVDKPLKNVLLLEVLSKNKYESTLIFTRTKHGANKLEKILKENKFKVAAIHGNKSQTNRQKTLEEFKNGNITTLVATDIAARGLDIDDLSFVINYDIPNIPETYVHRIGRTGRAGKSGIAISLCSREEVPFINDIQKLINKKIPVVDCDYTFKSNSNSEHKNKKKPVSSKSNTEYKGKAKPKSIKNKNSSESSSKSKSSKNKSGNENKFTSKPKSGKSRTTSDNSFKKKPTRNKK